MLIIAGVVAPLTAAGAGVNDAVTGSSTSISLYRAAVAKTNARPAIADVWPGYYWLESAGASTTTSTGISLTNPTFQPSIATVSAPKGEGFNAATAHYYVAMQDGKVQWWTVILDPLSTADNPSVPSLSVEIYATPTTVYYSYIPQNKGQAACWNLATTLLASWRPPANSGYWVLTGKYSPAVKSGSIVKIASVFPGSSGSEITEVDTINKASDLFTNSNVKAMAGSKTMYSYVQGYSYPAAVSAPDVSANICA